MDVSAGSEARGEAWRRIRELAHTPEALGCLRDLAEGAGLTPGIAKALLHLSAEHPTSMRELAAVLRCDNSYVTTVVDGLEARGMVRRRPHPTDRRIKIVELTDAGITLATRMRAAVDRPPASFAALSEEEAATLVGLLRMLSAD